MMVRGVNGFAGTVSSMPGGSGKLGALSGGTCGVDTSASGDTALTPSTLFLAVGCHPRLH